MIHEGTTYEKLFGKLPKYDQLRAFRDVIFYENIYPYVTQEVFKIVQLPTTTTVVKFSQWRDAMTQEIQALEENDTWSLEQLPKGKKVYKIKYKATGEIEKYKAQLVAKGYTQIEGEDYIETFALVAKMTIVQCLLTVAMAKGWELH
ncbi:hypothetical protein CR513_09204, partial [Mucuna pruriens]